MDHHRKSYGAGKVCTSFHLFCAGSPGYYHRSRGVGVHGIRQAECRVLRQPLDAACRVLLAELLPTPGMPPGWVSICSTRSSSPHWRCAAAGRCPPAAYCLSRFHFKGRRFLNTLFMAGLFINVNYIVVPIFLMLRDSDVGRKLISAAGFC